MITDLLPDIDIIIKQFTSPRASSIEAKIRSRAWQLAHSSHSGANQDCEQYDDPPFEIPAGKDSFSSSRTEQGQNTGTPKKSIEHRFRKSLDKVRTKVLRRSLDDGERPSSYGSQTGEEKPLSPTPAIRTYYLLISPLLPPISSLATFFSTRSPRYPQYSSSSPSKDENVDASSKLVRHTTLAIYGDRDMFTSSKKLQKWASELADQPHSRFRFSEVQGAGHFWVEDGVERQLRGGVKEWISSSVLPSPDEQEPQL